VPPLTAPFLALAVLVGAAGVAKLRRPADTAQALRTQGLPSSAWLVRVLGVVELTACAAALAGVTGSAAVVAGLYAGFTGFVVLALLRGRPLSSCGCFGTPDTPPSWVHASLTAAGAAAALGVALTAPAGLPAALDAGAGQAVAVLVGTAVVGLLLHAALAHLPAVVAASARGPQAEAPAHPALFQITVRSTA
jgi:hypothetical protein